VRAGFPLITQRSLVHTPAGPPQGALATRNGRAYVVRVRPAGYPQVPISRYRRLRVSEGFHKRLRLPCLILPCHASIDCRHLPRLWRRHVISHEHRGPGDADLLDIRAHSERCIGGPTESQTGRSAVPPSGAGSPARPTAWDSRPTGRA
jgi:hypothetical protein